LECKVIYHNNLPGNEWCILSNTAPKNCPNFSNEMYYAYSKQISSLNDTTPQFDPSKSECYDESKTLISGCYCHKDCAKCGFNKNPT
jgi:hypothetical protein